MFPVFFSIGKISVSSFGAFFALGLLFGIFLIWRLSRAWDLDEEKVLDLTLMTFVGGLIGARLYFGIQNLNLFSDNFLNLLFINKVSGFSFWGALLGGWATLFFASKIKKADFGQIGDIASIGLLGSLVFINLGCFFGGCGIGIVSKAIYAVDMVGFVGKRFPVQLLEAILLTLVLIRVWSVATHFHIKGRIIALTLIYLGLIRLLMLPLKQNQNQGFILSSTVFILGIFFFYRITKRNIILDLKNASLSIFKLFTNSNVRKLVYLRLKKYCYNMTTSISWKIKNFKKTLRRRNVKFS